MMMHLRVQHYLCQNFDEDIKFTTQIMPQGKVHVRVLFRKNDRPGKHIVGSSPSVVKYFQRPSLPTDIRACIDNHMLEFSGMWFPHVLTLTAV